MKHPLQQVGLAAWIVGAFIVITSNVLGLRPLATLGMMLVVSGLITFLMGSFAQRAEAERTKVSSQASRYDRVEPKELPPLNGEQG